jgi:hypothetical protein
MADARTDAYAKWLVENQDKKDTPEFKTVASAYRQLRQGGGTQAEDRPSPLIRFGANVWEGAASVPGLPVEIAALAKGIPVEQSNLAGWGAKGWSDFANRNIPGGLPSRKLPPAQGGLERVADKGGQFFGSGAVFGPSAMVSTGTSLIGSEVGRVADQVAPELTGGYGEAVGAVFGGVAPSANRGQVTSPTRAAPSAKELKDTARAFYDQADNAQVVINQSGVTRIARRIRGDLGRMAYRPALQPKIGTLLDEIDTSMQAGNVTLQDLDGIRRVARNIMSGTADATERRMAEIAIDHIDEVIDSLTPAEVVAGDAQGAAEALRAARDAWKRASKAEVIDDAVARAENRASSTYSGANTENTVRQNLRAILDSPKKRRQFSREELKLIHDVVKGGPVQNVMRLLGSLSPEKGAFQLLATIGAAALSPQMAVIPAAGMAGRAVSEAMNARNVQRLSESIRAGGAAQQLTASQRSAQIVQELARRAKLMAEPGAVATVGPANQAQLQKQ